MGGMAEIHLARVTGSSGFRRLVVVKRIRPELADKPEFVQMFLKEARVAAALHHSNVVQVFDLGEVDGHYYMVMELLLGADVYELMRAAGRCGSTLSLANSIAIVTSVC